MDLEYVKAHFNPCDPRLAGDGPLLGDGLNEAVALMLEQCPIVHSDGAWTGMPEGGWIVNRYEDVMTVLQDSEIYSSLKKKGLGDEPDMPPFESDPPLHTHFRHLLQPYLSLHAVSKFESTSREIITQHIDGFIEAGYCEDAVTQLCRPFSSGVQWKWLVGLDEIDIEQVQGWIETWVYRHFEPEFEEANRAWIAWVDDTVARRRREPRRDDLIDALVFGRIEDRPLTEDEIRGVVMIMILGGFTTTADVISNILMRIAVYPNLQASLRERIDILPHAIEELLRIEPPSTGLARRCTRDTVLAGQQLRAGEHVFYHIPAANLDESEFESPHEIDFERPRNRHLAFGAGRHRCLGSNFARMNLRIAVEEILTRMHDIRIPEGAEPRRTANVAWGMAHLPLEFTPGPRVGTGAAR
jgi:cytochrome P450